ncbi:hypothetical protein GL218_01146 [Daldinia childiae]|uniref:uncharacterized protein n=2 Tax=Daldinia childiae TaxID=326645 RepID=UPI00144882F1|nr:uncharacterized protein GL218_01146 [Daldinia childiae]KAF3063584.1 hypothetical protein GL218_01146 [Daldinia childiae]
MSDIFTSLDAEAAALIERMSWMEGTSRGHLSLLAHVVSSATTLRSNLEERVAWLEEWEKDLERRRLEQERSENERSNALVDRVEHLQICLDSLCKSLAKAGEFIDKESADLKGKLKEAQDEIKEKTLASSIVIGRIHEVAVKSNTLRKEIEEACVVNGRLEQVLKDIRPRIASIKKETAQTKKDMADLASTNSSLVMRNQELTKDLESARREAGEKNADLSSKLDGAEKELQSKTASLAESQNRVKALSKELEEMKVEGQNVQNDLTNKLREAEKELQSKAMSLTDASKLLAESQERIGALSKEMEAKNADSQKAQADLSNKLAAAEKASQDGAERIAELGKLLADSNKRVEALSGKLGGESKALEEKSNALSEASREL